MTSVTMLISTGLIDRQVGDDIEVTYCSKWPGNPELYEGKSNNVNKLKAFRISEMYLIAAEAYAMLNQEDKASEMLNELKRYVSKDGLKQFTMAQL